MSRIYLDHNATSPLRPCVQDALRSHLDKGQWANPSSVHFSGRAVRTQLDLAREHVAKYIHTSPENIIFTSGGTESNQWVYASHFRQQVHVLSSKLEHACVLSAHETMQGLGSRVTYLPISESYAPQMPKDLQTPIHLSSFHLANNETGLLFPYENFIRDHQARLSNTLFHTDAVQTLGKLPIYFDASPFHTMAFSGHKVGALQGVGFIARKKYLRDDPFWKNAAQEKGFRAGTENMLGILSLGAACQYLQTHDVEEQDKMSRLRNTLESELTARLPDIHIVGEKGSRLPNTSCILFHKVDGESLMMAADLDGLEISMGSACSSGSVEPSHVLLNMGFLKHEALSALRFSLGWSTTEQDIEQALATMVHLVNRIRTVI